MFEMQHQKHRMASLLKALNEIGNSVFASLTELRRSVARENMFMESLGDSFGTSNNEKKEALIVRRGARRRMERWCVSGSLEGANYTGVCPPAIMTAV